MVPVRSSTWCPTRATSTCPAPATWSPATATTRSRTPSCDSSARSSGVAEPGDEAVVVPIGAATDLHPFAPREIPSVVESYLEAAQQAGFTEVRLIHGRGRGVQRARVQKLLASHPLVASFRDAPSERGGLGATVVWLRQRGSV